MKRYALLFNSYEAPELLGLLKDNVKWKKRIEDTLFNYIEYGDVSDIGFQNCAECGVRSLNSGVTEKYFWLCDKCNGREKYKNISSNKIVWEKKSRSNIQFEVKQFLKSFWYYDLVYEEMPVIGSKMSLDIVNVSKKIAVEVHGRQHDKFVPFFHVNRNNFRRQIERDFSKEEWCQINNLKYVAIYPNDIKTLSKEWFLEKFEIIL